MKKIQYLSEQKIYPYFMFGSIVGAAVTIALLIYLAVDFAAIELGMRISILACIPALLILVYMTWLLRKNSRARQMQYEKLKNNGLSAKGRVVKVKVLEAETESTDKTERSTLEYYALVEYFDEYQRETRKKWTPELTGAPENGAFCRVYYDSNENIYVSFE